MPEVETNEHRPAWWDIRQLYLLLKSLQWSQVDIGNGWAMAISKPGSTEMSHPQVAAEQ